MELAIAAWASVVGGLTSLDVLIPAFLIGWMVRSTAQAVLGGVTVAVALFIFWQLASPIPEGATVVWLLVPLGLIAPVAWALAGFLLHRWVRRQAAAQPNNPGLRLLEAAAGAVIGAVLGAAVAIGAGVLFVEIFEVSNFEGAAGYLVFLGFGFPGVVIGFLVGAVVGWRRRRPRAAAV